MMEKITRLLSKFKRTDRAKKNATYSRFGIGPRLISAFSIVAILTVAISAISWISLDKITSAQKELIGQKVPAISIALKFSNETTALAASASPLANAHTEPERNQSYAAIKSATAKAKERLETIRGFAENDTSFKSIESSLTKLEENLALLNENVQKRIALSNELSSTRARLSVARDILDTELNSFLIPIRIANLDNLEKWNETLQKSIDRALTGVRPEIDTTELSKASTELLRFQENIYEFKSSGYQLLSLLTEGLQASDINSVKDLQSAFMSSISSMGTPLSEIEKATSKSKAKELSGLFSDFMELGIKSADTSFSLSSNDAGNKKPSKQVNIFKTKIEELEAAKAANDIANQSRFLAVLLANNVNAFTTEIEEKIASESRATLSSAASTKMTLLICAIVALLITVAIGWLYVRRNIIRRMMLLVASAQRLSEGDLTSSIYRDGSDEIARMGHALVGFRDTAREANEARLEADEQRKIREEEKAKQEEAQRQAEKSSQEERERTEREAAETKNKERNQLADAFEGSVKHMVEKFAAATAEMNGMSVSMTSSAEDTTQRSATVASASDLATSSVNSVAAATEELTSSINEISRQVNQAASIAGDAVSEAERTNIMVTSLNEAAAKIGDVVGLINDIAGQTNLLALNATIEAARAGDAGKGFAVVASEVKNLAAQTAKATEEITEQIRAVQEETGNAVGAIGGITTTISKINEIATSISAAVEEQGAATGEISRSVQQAAEGSQEVSHNISSVRDAAESTGKTALQVQEVSNDMAKEVSDLDREVENFLSQIRAS